MKDEQKAEHKDLEAEIKTFCELHNSLETRDFFEEMDRASLLRLDWPKNLGGRGWDRRAQLIVIKTLAAYGCPIFPEALSLGAPLVINLSPKEDRVFLLENLIRNLSTWRIRSDSGSEGIFWDQENDSLYVIYERKKYQLGGNGLAEDYLSKYFSIGCLLQQWLSGIFLSKNLNRTIKGSNENEITEEEINFSAAEILFLSSKNEKLQALRANSGRIKTHQILTSLIAYEGLLKRNDKAGSNEPRKFLKEHLFLESIESQVSLNEILIKDLVYEESLNKYEQ